MNTFLRQFSETQVAGFFLVLGRVSPLFVLAPLFSSRMLPPRARLIVALALTVGLAPVAVRGQKVPVDGTRLLELMIKELLIGLAFAFAVGAVLAAVAAAGTLIDTFAGYSYGALVDPITGNQSAVISQVYGLVGLMVFIAIGGDALVIQGLARTYDFVPLLGFPAIDSLVGGVQTAFVSIFTAALELAAPVMLALLITDAAFGLMARVVPQLNVFAVGFPAKMIVGLVMVVAAMPFAGGWIADQLDTAAGGSLDSLEVR